VSRSDRESLRVTRFARGLVDPTRTRHYDLHTAWSLDRVDEGIGPMPQSSDHDISKFVKDGIDEIRRLVGSVEVEVR